MNLRYLDDKQITEQERFFAVNGGHLLPITVGEDKKYFAMSVNFFSNVMKSVFGSNLKIKLNQLLRGATAKQL